MDEHEVAAVAAVAAVAVVAVEARRIVGEDTWGNDDDDDDDEDEEKDAGMTMPGNLKGSHVLQAVLRLPSLNASRE